MKLQTKSVCESRQVIENPDNVRNLEAAHLIKTDRTQNLPVRDGHARRIGTQFLSDRA